MNSGFRPKFTISNRINRRSLQRDLKAMLDMDLLVSEGATNKLVYRMKETG